MLVQIPNALRVGFGETCEIRAVDVEDFGLSGMAFTVCYGGQTMRMHVPSPGKHSVQNALAAIGVGTSLGVPLELLAKGVEAYLPPKGRMSMIRTNRFTLLDDSYNANPNSVMAAVDVLERVEGRRVCILGDMLELGEQSNEYHSVVGMYAALHGIDLIICVGPNSKQMFSGALELAPDRARYFETTDSLANSLPSLLLKGDTVLVKASHGMRLDRIVQLLKEM